MANIYNLEITQGVPQTIPVEYKNADETPKDLSNYAGVGSVKRKASDCETIGNLTVNVIDAANGKVEIIFPKVLFENEKIKSTNPKELDSFVYDSYLYNPTNTNDVIKLIAGTVKVSPQITKIPSE